MIRFIIILNYVTTLLAVVAIPFIKIPQYVYVFPVVYIAYRLLSDYMDIFPKSTNTVITLLRDIASEAFIVLLVLYNTKYATNLIVIAVLFAILFGLTRLEGSSNKVIAFISNYFPFDIPMLSWAIYRIVQGHYETAIIFIAYAGWVYWYIKQDEQPYYSLWAYTVWSLGLLGTFFTCVV